MKLATQHVHGKLIAAGEQHALLLLDADPEEKTAVSLFLHYAFVLKGPETHIFPAFLLDDWGAEIKGLELYRWVREFGEQFPRAEVFGYTADGQETQRFLREIELYVRLPCYAFPERGAPVTAAAPVAAVLLLDATVTEPVRIKRPSTVERPLRGARVNWWRTPPDIVAFDAGLLD